VKIHDTQVEALAELESLVGAIVRHDHLGAEAAMTRHISRTLQSAQLELSQRLSGTATTVVNAGDELAEELLGPPQLEAHLSP
jgi:hypothetical protein